MRYIRKFKDEFIVVFDGEKFEYDGRTYEIHGVTGVDVDKNIVQVRDDLWVGLAGSDTPLSFEFLCNYWSRMTPALIKIVKQKPLISTTSVA